MFVLARAGQSAQRVSAVSASDRRCTMGAVSAHDSGEPSAAAEGQLVEQRAASRAARLAELLSDPERAAQVAAIRAEMSAWDSSGPDER